MENTALLLSIRPEYAQKILDGTKTAELRRVEPRLTKGDVVLVYASSPMKALLGGFTVDRVVDSRPRTLWRAVKDRAGITYSDFINYYSGASRGYGIFFKEFIPFAKPIYLETLRKQRPDFRPPQGYWYVTAHKRSNQTSLGSFNSTLFLRLLMKQS